MVDLIAQGRFSEPPLKSFANFPCYFGPDFTHYLSERRNQPNQVAFINANRTGRASSLPC